MERFCKNHVEKQSNNSCYSCGDYFCKDCLNKGKEYYYCNNADCYKRYIEEVGIAPQKKVKTSLKIAAVIVSIVVMVLAGTIGKQLGSSLLNLQK